MATIVARGSGTGASVHGSVKQPQTPTSPRSLYSSLKNAIKGSIPEEAPVSPVVPIIPPAPMSPGGIQRSTRSSSDKCRTQKKLCFREPEVISHSTSSLHKIGVISESGGGATDDVGGGVKKKDVGASALRSSTKSSLRSSVGSGGGGGDKARVVKDDLDDLEVGCACVIKNYFVLNLVYNDMCLRFRIKQCELFERLDKRSRSAISLLERQARRTSRSCRNPIQTFLHSC